MKPRPFVAHLVVEHGFSLFAIEDQVAEASLVDRALRDPAADPVMALEGLRFWPWKNEEMGELVKWMQELAQARGGDAVGFHGFDTQAPFLAVEELRPLVEKLRPDLLSGFDDAAEAVGGEPPFGYARVRFPAGDFRNMTIRVSVATRTTDVRDGWASFNLLAWQAGEERPIASRHSFEFLTGTRDWTVRAVEFDVPGDADLVGVVFFLQGNGVAEFGDVTIEGAGGEWVLRIGIKDGDPSLFIPEMPEFDVEVVKDAHEGGSSLRIASKSGELDAEVDAPAVWSAFLSDLVEGYSIEGPEEDLKEYQRAIRLATSVDLTLRAQAGEIDREAGMAKNIETLLDHKPGKRLILWGHNVHLAKQSSVPGLGDPPMGAYLREAFGDAYFTFGLVVGSGSYRAYNRETGELAANPLPHAPDDSLENIFAVVGDDLALLPIYSLEADLEEMVLLHQLPGHTAVANPFFGRTVFRDYDAIIWLPEVTAWQVIDFRARDSKK